MTLKNLQGMTVLLERTEQTEPYFLLAHAIIGGLVRPAEAMRYVREYTPAGENKLNAEAMLFIGLVLADFRRGYERRTPSGSPLRERLEKERYTRAGDFLKYAKGSVNGFCPWAYVDLAMRMEEAINGPATVRPSKAVKGTIQEVTQRAVNGSMKQAAGKPLSRAGLLNLSTPIGTIQ